MGKAAVYYDHMAKKRRQPAFTPAKVKSVRDNLGLTQAEAAEKVGVSRRAWAAWESGERQLSPSSIILLRLLAEGKL